LGKVAHWRIKTEVIRHYSPFLVCVRCGYDDIRALSMDHIDGGGDAHRRRVLGYRGGNSLYYWLRRNQYPPGFQVLCMNCQWIKRHEMQEYHSTPLGVIPIMGNLHSM